jgi:hypothetical protein
MMQHNKKVGSRSKATGKKRVPRGSEAREVVDTSYTNAPHGKRALTPFFLLLAIISGGLLLSIVCESAVEAKESKRGEATDVLVVKSSLTEPAVPLNLDLTVRLFAKERLLEITGRVGKHPAYPATLFFDKDVKVQIKLPQGLQLHEGSLSWQGDLNGEEIGQFRATVEAVRDLEGAVDVSAIGYAAVGGRVDADSVRFYVLVKGQAMRISLNPFTPFEFKPGTAGQVK